MKSSTGAHYPALDHIRAVAAWLVFTWHFTHGLEGSPIPFSYTPTVPLAALWDEGHTGVALFMTLSGYLFAKLLDGREVHYPSFLWNRAVRLLPLLTVVIVLATPWGGGEERLRTYVWSVVQGVVWPTLPNGGWSITTEVHFYLLLPLLLWLGRLSRLAPLALIATAVVLRGLWFEATGQVQWSAYWTIFGRIDQFSAGILAFYWRREIIKHPRLVVLAIVAFIGLYWYFDATGGFYLSGSYPSSRPLWIILPSAEGAAYGTLIAAYDGMAQPAQGRIARLVERAGEYSYSIYLLHFFVVFRLARFINDHVMGLSSFPIACAWATVSFAMMLIPGYLSFRFIEGPCLRWRRSYIVKREADALVQAG